MYLHLVSQQKGMWTTGVMEKGFIKCDLSTITSASSAPAVMDLGGV